MAPRQGRSGGAGFTVFRDGWLSKIVSRVLAAAKRSAARIGRIRDRDVWRQCGMAIREMVTAGGLEPPTFRATIRRSNLLSLTACTFVHGMSRAWRVRKGAIGTDQDGAFECRHPAAFRKARGCVSSLATDSHIRESKAPGKTFPQKVRSSRLATREYRFRRSP